jgi:hypothetical protein
MVKLPMIRRLLPIRTICWFLGFLLAGNAFATEPSKAKAFLMSFVLPGSGEWASDAKHRAVFFLGVETMLWATHVILKQQAVSQEHDYRLFASAHAGFNPVGKDHEDFVNVENYPSVRAYNEAKLQQRNLKAVYPEDALHSWKWDGEADRRSFETMRARADRRRTASLFMIGGIVANHIISGIDAAWSAGRASSVRVGVAGLPEGGAVFLLTKSF